MTIISEPPLIDTTALSNTNDAHDNSNSNYLQLFDKYVPFVRISIKTCYLWNHLEFLKKIL